MFRAIYVKKRFRLNIFPKVNIAKKRNFKITIVFLCALLLIKAYYLQSYSTRLSNTDTLPACTRYTCFNNTRCTLNRKVFVYEQANPILDKEDVGSPYYGYLPRVPDVTDSKYTRNPKDACFFAVYIWAVEYDYSKLPLLPYWNDGLNHIIIDFKASRFSKRGKISAEVIGKSILAKSYMTTDYFRPNFDLAVPILKLSRTQANIERICNSQILFHEKRKHFLTFKGSVYLEGTPGSYRWKLLDITQEEDVTIHIKCFRMHGWHMRTCKNLDKLFRTSDYIDLLNTTFALVPGGRQPATYRLIEALSAGAIPVFVYPDVDWIKPYSHLIDWDKISFTFSPQEIPDILPKLRRLSTYRVTMMQKEVVKVYVTHFGNPTQMASHIFDYAMLQLLT